MLFRSLAPKRSPAPPNPWIRWGAIGALGTVAATTIGYFLMSDNWNLEEQIESLRNKLQNTSKVTSKYQQKSDQVAMVETWLSDQVDWVAELSDLASRLPDGQEATVRRLSASINAKGNGTIDLAMQVASQEVIAELENRIRGAKYTIVSKQITQNADSQEYPWQFESHIEFPIAAPPLKRFSPVAKTTAPKNATNPEPKKGTDSPDKPESNQEGIEEQPPENKPESTEGAAR